MKIFATMNKNYINYISKNRSICSEYPQNSASFEKDQETKLIEKSEITNPKFMISFYCSNDIF